MTMTHASLFSGIGGFDLAAEWAGWTNAFNCEIDPFCRKILKYHFPDAEQYEDIRTTDFAVWRDCIDVLTGGFPCQPFSLAGKRKGTEDDRYLWPEMLRVIRTVRPRWVVGENVFGIINWSEGMVFDKVCSDLEAAGYEVQPYIIPACGVGAPHRRDRCWFVAHRTDASIETMREGQDGVHAVGAAADTDSNRCRIGAYQPESVSGSCRPTDNRTGGSNGTSADTYGCYEFQSSGQSSQTQERIVQNGNAKRRIFDWSRFPTGSPVCDRNDGFPGELAGISFPAWCRESIKACGNAIVPQAALQIFETINKYEKL
jgi:DNA (cytosine-5)-methyltransferase 1